MNHEERTKRPGSATGTRTGTDVRDVVVYSSNGVGIEKAKVNDETSRVEERKGERDEKIGSKGTRRAMGVDGL